VSGAPDIRRVRHETRRRNLTIDRVEPLGSNMLRVVVRGDALEGFISLGFDDHIKLFLPPGDAMRDFTPRRYDARAGELWIDFFLHEAGPAATWAAQAAAGQTLTIGGPRGSAVISPEGIDCHLMIGDETALPAIGRRLDELPAGARMLAVIETEDGSPGYPLNHSAAGEFVWIRRNPKSGAPAQGLIESMRTLNFPHERCFAWAALESQSARAVRRYLVNERGFDKHWIKAAGYWQRDAAGVHEVIQDDE
jgi:NADPH-dependent ferric siderophore reductase